MLIEVQIMPVAHTIKKIFAVIKMMDGKGSWAFLSRASHWLQNKGGCRRIASRQIHHRSTQILSLGFGISWDSSTSWQFCILYTLSWLIWLSRNASDKLSCFKRVCLYYSHISKLCMPTEIKIFPRGTIHLYTRNAATSANTNKTQCC